VRTTYLVTQVRNGGAWPAGAIIDPDTGAVICADGCFITSDEHTLNSSEYTDTTSIVYGISDCRPENVPDSYTRIVNRHGEALFYDIDPAIGGGRTNADTYSLVQAVRTRDNCTPRLLNPQVEVTVDESTVESGNGAYHVAYPFWPMFENVVQPDGTVTQEYCNFSATDEVREVADPTFIEGNPVRIRTSRTLTGSRDCFRGEQRREVHIEQYECTVPEGDGRTFSPGIKWNDVRIVEVFEWDVEVISRERCEVTQCVDRSGDPPSPLPLAPESDGRFFRRVGPSGLRLGGDPSVRAGGVRGGGCGGCGSAKVVS
jgi:hypothetical protein